MREEQPRAQVMEATARSAFFAKRGDAYEPLPLAMSPWNTAHQGGMAIAGLLMHEAEQVPAPVPMTSAHVTIDILKATPFAPVRCRASIVREGKRLQMVEVELLAGGDIVARARVLRACRALVPAGVRGPEPGDRSQPGELDDGRPDRTVRPGPPDSLRRAARSGEPAPGPQLRRR